jgi:phosphopantetheinyl transferase
MWVLKEAYLKCLGSGLAGGLDSIECRIEPPSIEMRAATAAHLALYSAGGAFLGIAVCGAELPSVRVEHWPPDSAYSAEASLRFIAASAPDLRA